MWIYESESLEEVPSEAIGFIYQIVNLTKRSKGETPYLYVGKKNLFSEITKKLGKRELAELTDRRKSKKKKIKKESEWRSYQGSCSQLLEDINKGDVIEKHILEFCYSKSDLSYREVVHQIKCEVLEKIEYYNGNILNRFFSKIKKY